MQINFSIHLICKTIKVILQGNSFHFWQVPNSFSPEILLMDLMNYNNMREPVSKGLKLFGKVDIVINNAGVSYRGEISSTQIQVDERVMAVNYFGQIALIKGKKKNSVCIFYEHDESELVSHHLLIKPAGLMHRNPLVPFCRNFTSHEGTRRRINCRHQQCARENCHSLQISL